MRFGKIKKIVLIGGGYLLYHFAKESKKKFKIDIIIGPRHKNQKIIGNNTLASLVKNLGKNYFIKDLNESFLKKNYSNISETLFLSFDSPWIFKKDLIKKYFFNKLINSHSTRLPQNRGGGGFSWRILNQDKLGFCSLHLIDSNKIDSGDIIMVDEFIFPYNLSKPFEYEKFQLEKEIKFQEEFLKRIIKNHDFNLISQPQYLSTYFPRLSTNDNGWIDWSLKIESLFNFISAFDDPYQGARTYYKREPVRLKNVNLTKSDQIFHPYQYGIIYRKSKDFFLVGCNQGSLIVTNIFNKKGRNIFKDINVGDRLFTPLNKLDSSKDRVYYDSKGKKIK